MIIMYYLHLSRDGDNSKQFLHQMSKFGMLHLGIGCFLNLQLVNSFNLITARREERLLKSLIKTSSQCLEGQSPVSPVLHRLSSDNVVKDYLLSHWTLHWGCRWTFWLDCSVGFHLSSGCSTPSCCSGCLCLFRNCDAVPSKYNTKGSFLTSFCWLQCSVLNIKMAQQVKAFPI